MLRVRSTFSRRLISRFGLALAASLTLLATVALPASAYAVKGTGFNARFDGPRFSGLVVVDRTDRETTSYQVGGSPESRPSEQMSLNFRSIGCNGTPTAANREFRLQGTTNARGQLIMQGGLSSNIDFDAVESVWVNVAGEPATCSAANHFETVNVAGADFNGDRALGLVKTGAGTLTIGLVEKRPNGRARLSVIANNAHPQNAWEVTFANRSCGTAPTNSYKVTMPDILVSGYFKSTTVNMSQNQLDALRSIRVRDVDRNVSWCAPLSIIMANTEGD